ncbi:hypothetical protein ACOSP7_004982 [Xanthoceras sorbifolium]
MRGNRTKKQSKFKQIISAPIKVLCKVRDFYMMGIDDCTGKASCSGVVGCPMIQVAPLPKSLKASDDDDDDQELPWNLFSGAASRTVKVDDGAKAIEISRTVRSYSVGVGKIGRIDENMPCTFEEEEGLNTDLLNPRSTSHALKRNFVHR